MGRRFQSALGSEFTRRYKEGQQVDTLMLMSVTKVNYKYNTVDLIALKYKERFTTSYETEGKYSAKLPMEFGGRNIIGQPYGQINPITVGTIVLVGFVQGDKNNPIILSVYGNNSVTEKLARAPFASADPTDESLAKQMYQKFTLYPSLTYDSIDGDGTRIVSFSGKSFLVFDTAPNTNATMISDGNYGTTYEDLGTSFYNDGEVIEPMVGLAPNVLFKHQGILDSEDKPDKHQFMIHIASDGTYRTSQLNRDEDWRTLFEMTPEGEVRLRRQGDTIRLNDGVEIGEIVIDKYGIVKLRNGEMDLEVRKDGLYSQGKPLGDSIGGGNVDLSDIYDKLDQLGDDVAWANTEITNIGGEVKVVSEKTTIIDGQVKEMEASVSIMADQIQTKVSETQVEEMIDDSLSEVNADIQKVKDEADKANGMIADMANDNRVTPAEKKDLLAEWEIIQSEYPSYINQANVYEVSSDEYEETYSKLEDFVTPLLADMEATSVVDGVTMRNRFKAYYNARIALLNDILKGLKDGITEAMKKASEAQLDATDALADSAQAQIDAGRANELINDIASDGKLTASEKTQLKKEWDIIVKEYPKTLQQAVKYKVNTDELTLSYNSLKNIVEPLLTDLTQTSIVNGEELRNRMSDYYANKTQVLKDISDLAQDIMTDYGNRISVAETAITQTAEAITLMATKVETIEGDVRANKAQIEINAEQISQKVTASEVKDVVDDAINDIQVGGTNLFVIYTQTKGWLNETDGTVGTVQDNSVVSNYIKVRATSPYVASLFNNTATNTIVICWYDTNRKFLSGQAVADTGDFSQAYKSPANAVYARISYKRANITLIKFEAGTKATDFSYAWEDIKNDQTLLEQYIKDVQEQAENAQQSADDAQANADHANKQIDDIANDNILTPSEKQQLALQWEEIQTEYPLNLAQASKFGVNATQYTNMYNALETYLTPILEDLASNSVIIGSTLRTTFKNYYDRRTTLLNTIAEIAKTLADNAQNKADQLDDDLDNIGGYNYVGFSSGDEMLPRLMVKNVGYYEISDNATQAYADNMVSLKPKSSASLWYYTIGTSNKANFTSLADFRMKEVKEGQWLTASANLQVIGGGTATLRIYTYENGWKESISQQLDSSAGIKRVVVQRKVTSATTGVFMRVYVNNTAVTEVRFGNVQLEVGIRSTPWKKSDIDIKEDINNVAKELQDNIDKVEEQAKADSDRAIADAKKAQETADKAQEDANRANQSVANLSDDNLATPNEKLDLKKEWEVIVAEKPINDAQADKFGVSRTDYGTKYTALANYLSPILSNLTVNSTIVGQTMRDTFKAYYTARTNLLNAIAVKAKELADKAQDDVNNMTTTTAWCNDLETYEGFTRIYPNENLLPEKIGDTNVWSVGTTEVVADETYKGYPVVQATSSGADWQTVRRASREARIPFDGKKGDKVSFSVALKGVAPATSGATNMAQVLVEEYETDTSNRYQWGGDIYPSLTIGKWNEYSNTYTIRGDTTKYLSLIILFRAGNKANTTAFRVSIPKLELGSIPTIYTPPVKIDPAGAKMKYQGIGVKPSDNPEDYVWSPSGSQLATVAWCNDLDTYEDFTLTQPSPNLQTNSRNVAMRLYKPILGESTSIDSTMTSDGWNTIDLTSVNQSTESLPVSNLIMAFKAGETITQSFRVRTDANVDVNKSYNFSWFTTASATPGGHLHVKGFIEHIEADEYVLYSTYIIPPGRDNIPIRMFDGQLGDTLQYHTSGTYLKFSKFKIEKGNYTGFVPSAVEDEKGSKMKYVGISNVPSEDPRDFVWSLSTEYSDNDKQNQLNGKEGTWIYQPTEPTNPAIGLVWVDTTETPYQPRRYTGAETGWIPLTPEEVSDLPWGEDGSNLADWVAEAEQKITATAIINTVIESNDFTTIFDSKANLEDLESLATYDDLDAMQAEYERLLQEGLDGIDFTPYVTQSELEQLKDSFNFSIQQAGGVNLLQNSLGFAGLNFWDGAKGENLLSNTAYPSSTPASDGYKLYGASGATMIYETASSSNTYKGKRITITNSSTAEAMVGTGYAPLEPNTDYTVSVKVLVHGSLAGKVTSGDLWFLGRKAGETAEYTKPINLVSGFKAPENSVGFFQGTFNSGDLAEGYVRVDSNGSTVSGGESKMYFWDLKLEKGTVATAWSPKPSEVGSSQLVQTTQNADLSALGFGSGFLIDSKAGAVLQQQVSLPETKAGLMYGASFYMKADGDIGTIGNTADLSTYTQSGNKGASAVFDGATNVVTFTTAGAYEILYTPLTVEVGKTYQVTYKYRATTAPDIKTGYVAVNTSVPTGTYNTNVIGSSEFTTDTANTEFQTQSFTFTAQQTNVYLQVNGGGLTDGKSYVVEFANMQVTPAFSAGMRIYEHGVLKQTVGLTDLSEGLPAGYLHYATVWEPELPDVTVELFVDNGENATVVISGVMLNIGNLALKWQPYPTEIYNTNVRIDINGITVKNNQTNGYTLITPQEFSGYAMVDGESERIFTLNGQVTEVKMLRAEQRITMEPITIFAMNSENNQGWAFVGALQDDEV